MELPDPIFSQVGEFGAVFQDEVGMIMALTCKNHIKGTFLLIFSPNEYCACLLSKWQIHSLAGRGWGHPYLGAMYAHPPSDEFVAWKTGMGDTPPPQSGALPAYLPICGFETRHKWLLLRCCACLPSKCRSAWHPLQLTAAPFLLHDLKDLQGDLWATCFHASAGGLFKIRRRRRIGVAAGHHCWGWGILPLASQMTLRGAPKIGGSPT